MSKEKGRQKRQIKEKEQDTDIIKKIENNLKLKN